MSVTVNPRFMEELRPYGEFDVQGCYSCGHCTAICPLVQSGESFPRRVIRYAQLGIRERLASAKEVWSCYYCGKCSETCPRQATPGEFMDCARRYFIVHWDLTGLSRRLYTSPVFTAALLGGLGLFLAAIFLVSGGRMDPLRLDLFRFIDVEWLHYTGIVVMSLVGLVLVANVGHMVVRLAEGLPSLPKTSLGGLLADAWLAVRDTLTELGLQRRFSECESLPSEEVEPVYRSRRTIHLTIMWGFLGLFGATALDLLFKEPGSHVPLYYPARLLGTVSGALLLYGTTWALYLRYKGQGGASFRRSYLSDWLLLGLLGGTTLTGFLVEIAVYLPRGFFLGYMIFLLHVVLALELLLLLPFTKLSHAVYRPLALWIHAFWGRRSCRSSLRGLWASRTREGGP